MPVTTAPNRSLARPREVADYLRVTTRTLEAWRAKGEGPRYISLNRRGDVRYRWPDVEEFLRRREDRAPGLVAASTP